MRTTLAIDEDVFSYARAHAQRERISLGEAVSRLARQGIQSQNRVQSRTLPAPARLKSRYALLPARAEVITPQHVRQLMEQEGI